MAVTAVVFGLVSSTASTSATSGVAYGGRYLAILVALVAAVLVAWSTLSPWPLAAYERTSAGSAAKTIQVTGYQWRWELSSSDVPVGKPVEFVVTAADVNHGFAIYETPEKMLGQVQAMPGFHNRLIVTFPKAGEYLVLCLEYCGVAHHGMKVVITAR